MREKIPSNMHFLAKSNEKEKRKYQKIWITQPRQKKEYLTSNEDKSPPGTLPTGEGAIDLSFNWVDDTATRQGVLELSSKQSK